MIVVIMSNDTPIKSERAVRFAEEYAKDRNGLQAAIRAGYSVRSAGQQASALLKDPKVQALIEKQCAAVAKTALFEAADVLREWVDIATADPTRIARVRQVNCRNCWGIDHGYQWRAREYAEACDIEMKLGNAPPECAGGFGFVGNRPPHPDCPECHGEGVTDTYFEDMDKLPRAEKRLIAGVKKTKDGLEIKYRDQDGALKNIAQYIGMLVEKKELTGKDGGPIATVVAPVELPADPEQLQTLYGKLLG